MFWIQKITEYADPRYLSSTNLGTDGHNAAGTSENDTPNRMIAAYAIGFV